MKKVRHWFAALGLLALGAASAEAQSRRVTGTVTQSGSSTPVGSATVQVVGTALGALTNETGQFALSVPAGPQSLRIRRIGYKATVIPLPADQSSVNVSLERDVLELETQVVTGTATTVSSLNAANDVAVVSSERLNAVPAPTIDQALQGKIAGAVISTNSGAPGGGTQITLRGSSTILGTYTPLYVVDGVIVSNTTIPSGLNALTHAASGTASNFSSSQDQSVNRIADINPNDIESIQVLKGPSAASIYGSKGTNGVIVITTKQGRTGKAQVDVTQRVGAAYLSNTIGIRCFASGAEVDAAGFDSTGFGAATNKCHDYQKEFYGNHPLSYQTVASIRGGSTSGTTYFLSGLAQHDNGLALNDYYNKQSLRVNLGQTVGQRLTVRGSTELVHTLTQRGISGNDNTGISPYEAFSGTPSFVDLRRSANGKFPLNPFGAANPFEDADRIKTPEDVYRLIGSVTGNLNIFATQQQNLDAVVTAGVDAYNDNSSLASPASTQIEQNNANPGTVLTSNGNVRFANLTGSLAHRYTARPLTATTSIGFRQERRQSDLTQVTGLGLPFDGTTSISVATQTFPFQQRTLTKDMSYFVQEEVLMLSERLLLTAGLNSERSSNNGDQAKFFSYPKYSASYRVPGLPSFVNEFKGRVAYGKAGNFPTAGRVTFATVLLDEGQQGVRPSTTKGAASIRPEIAGELEGGFDASLFNGRLGLKATQFRKQVDDLLLLANLPPSTGFTQQYINGGQLVNHGTEIELDLSPVRNFHGFDWQSTTTYASAKGKITQLPVEPFNPGVGSFGATFGNVFIQRGYSPNMIQAYTGCNVPLSATGTCAASDRRIGFVGDAAPDYQMGFNNDFTLGAFRVTSLVDWRKGGKAVNLTNNYFDGGLLADTALGNARLRGLAAGQPVYVENAGFVKIREITFGYTLPASFTNSLRLGTAHDTRIELSGRNLYTWTKYTGLDPEVSNFGGQAVGRIQDVTPYPPSRAYYFSINTSF